MIIFLVVGIFACSVYLVLPYEAPNVSPVISAIFCGTTSVCFAGAIICWMNFKDKIKRMESKIEKLTQEVNHERMDQRKG